MSRLARTLNLVAGCALALFAIEVAIHVDGWLARADMPFGAIAVLCVWACAAAWAAVVLIGRAG